MCRNSNRFRHRLPFAACCFAENRDGQAAFRLFWAPHAIALADPTPVEQVFGNLLGNAVNYLDRGRPGRIEVGTLSLPEGDGKLVRNYVRDNGMGIPASYLPKMFVAFQRLHRQIAPGEGVGLAPVEYEFFLEAVKRLGLSLQVVKLPPNRPGGKP